MIMANTERKNHPQGLTVGRYAIFSEISSGGMATVHFGRLLGPVGFSRTVAIKRLHEQYAKDPEFVAMFVDEARLAARIRHPNVVPTLDIVALRRELLLVMEYVHGESFSRLLRTQAAAGVLTPLRIVGAVMVDALEGLHAAHEALSERGQPLEIVHRDVSPANILVGTDGVSRVLDFGVATASGRLQTTREGQLKGKLSHMPPEQLHGAQLTRRADVYAAGTVVWEALVGRKLFTGASEAEIITNVIKGNIEPPSAYVPDLPPLVDEVLRTALAFDEADRYPTARAFAEALERACGVAPRREVAQWVNDVGATSLARRSELLAQIESLTSSASEPPPAPDADGAIAIEFEADNEPSSRSVKLMAAIEQASFAPNDSMGPLAVNLRDRNERSRSGGLTELPPASTRSGSVRIGWSARPEATSADAAPPPPSHRLARAFALTTALALGATVAFVAARMQPAAAPSVGLAAMPQPAVMLQPTVSPDRSPPTAFALATAPVVSVAASASVAPVVGFARAPRQAPRPVTVGKTLDTVSASAMAPAIAPAAAAPATAGNQDNAANATSGATTGDATPHARKWRTSF